MAWPKSNSKKPNALMNNDETRRWLFPNGHYVVTKRFSSKEEKRRVVANVVDPKTFDSDFVGFENVFHSRKKPISKTLAHGLSLFLNSSFVDDYFRSFSGHTQVNATDLRSLRYPSKEQLLILGAQVKNKTPANQADIDNLIMELK
jgi:adenine-specific DNA-methyltransferase